MRGLRSTLFLLAVLAGLVAYIYFVEWNRPAGGEDEREDVFASATAADIEEITITSDGGERSTLRKSGDAWNIVEPVQAEADDSELSSITSALESLEVQRVVDENASDFARYGLDPARVEVEFRTKGQSSPNRLLLGDKTPTGGDLYARTPDKPRVFLVASYLDSTFNKDTFALRDKRILEFERDKVETVELTSGGSTVQLVKQGTEWRIAKPIQARGDFGTIEGIVERLNSAEMQSIAAPEPGDLRQYGLDAPASTAVVGTGSARATLLLGKTENAVIFAKDAARPVIFTVAPTIRDDVFKAVSDLRRRDLFDSRSFTATRVEFRRGGETLAFEKTKGKDDMETWRNAAGADVDAARMQELLGNVTALRADSFEPGAHPSLKNPALTVTVQFDEGKTETVTFGRAGEDVFASRADEPGAAKLGAMPFDEVVKALDALKS